MPKFDMPEAGRDLDALVGYEVLGWTPVRGDWWPAAICKGEWNCRLDEADALAFEYPSGVPMPDGKFYCSNSFLHWRPSTEIKEAFELVKHILATDTVDVFSLDRDIYTDSGEPVWFATFEVILSVEDRDRRAIAEATECLAICGAALKWAKERKA